MSNSTRCAACKSLRRRCPQDCVLAPYFPSNNPQRFANVHKVFGASNITKMLQQLPVQLRGEAADCMSFEASSRVRDPVYGCVRIITQLRQQIIDTQTEIAKTNGEIAFYNAQVLQQEIVNDSEQHGDALWLNSSEQVVGIDLDQQQYASNFQRSNFY